MLERHWVPEPNTGCWLWTSAVDRYGYGKVKYRGRLHKAHRLIFNHLSRIEPCWNDQVLDHKCRVRCCVNPDHMEPVTARENNRRGVEHRRMLLDKIGRDL